MTSSHSIPHDLLNEPLWRPEDLGRPLPLSAHANSVCLPTWADVIDYEKAEPRVLQRLQTGYPRFFMHPLTVQLFESCLRRFAAEGELCQVYPSHAAAERCLASVRRWSGLTGRIVPWAEQGPFVCCLPQAAAAAAKKHWRHSGEGLSSRRAEALLLNQAEPDATDALQTVRERVARLTGATAENVYLFGSGMAAIYTVYRALNRLTPDRRSVQFGFPYVDTLKVQQDLGAGVHFLPRGDQQDLARLQGLLGAEPISAVFCEFPSNPLLVSPDLAALRDLAERYRFPLAVDETLGTYVNVDVLSAADVLTTSLTKYFTGAGDVLAGAAIVNPRSPFAEPLRETLAQESTTTLWGDDALLLAEYSADFADRVQRINRTAEQVCDFCRAHPAMAEVHYPKFSAAENYAAFRRPSGGYGGLFSVVLRDPQRRTQPFFDALRISKGPNLGTYFSLSCPFTQLAHFEELDFAESCGVSRYLIRISVGLEDPEDLIGRLAEALPQ